MSSSVRVPELFRVAKAIDGGDGFTSQSLSGTLLKVAKAIENLRVADAIGSLRVSLFMIGTGVCMGLIAVGIGVGYGLSRGNRGDYFTN